MSGSESSSLKSITEHFEELPDPRSEVNREHLLVDVIVISICAILAGADGPTAIAAWAKSPSVSVWLKQHLALPKGIPSKDTYRRVLQRLQPQAFQKCFESWLQQLGGTRGCCRSMASRCEALMIGSRNSERCTW